MKLPSITKASAWGGADVDSLMLLESNLLENVLHTDQGHQTHTVGCWSAGTKMADSPCGGRVTEPAERLCSRMRLNDQRLGSKHCNLSPDTTSSGKRKDGGWKLAVGACGRGALLASSSHDLQQEAEQVDDVQVDAEGGEDVFLRADGVTLVAQQHLSVERQELWRERGVSRKHDLGERTEFDSYHCEEDGPEDGVGGV